jgi:hypothetical protein
MKTLVKVVDRFSIFSPHFYNFLLHGALFLVFWQKVIAQLGV